MNCVNQKYKINIKDAEKSQCGIFTEAWYVIFTQHTQTDDDFV